MKHLFTLLSLAVVALSLSGCSKELSLESEDEGTSASATGNNTLTVKTRSISVSDGETANVSFPVNVYVFNATGKCVALQSIANDGEAVSFKLKKGSYTLYGLAGATAEAYSLPSQDEAAPETVVTLKEGQSHGELMTGNAGVKVADGSDNTLTLALKRKVMEVESVTISNVPTAVTAVSVNFAPLYSSVKLNGDYEGATGNHTIALAKTAEGMWQSTDSQYLLEASSAASITVAMTADGQAQSYSYVCTDELKANYKLNISGTYATNEFELTGTIKGEEWAGTKNITFTFSDEGSDETTEPDTPSTSVEDDKVGTLYASNKAFVVSATKNDDGSKTYLLMSTSQIKTSCSAETQETAKALVDKELKALSKVANSTGWRLPTKEELVAFKEQRTTYSKLPGAKAEAFTYSETTSYFYQKDADTIAALLIASEEDKSAITGTIYLRAFTTLTISE